jgi:hypothetical protein
MIKRIQRKRTKNWKAPSGTVYVGRPTRWGNPFKVDSYTPNRTECIETFRDMLITRQHGTPLWFDDFYLVPLKNKKYLSCWCKIGELCHADIWINFLNERANKREIERTKFTASTSFTNWWTNEPTKMRTVWKWGHNYLLIRIRELDFS